MGKTLPEEEEAAEGSPRKKALRVDDAAATTGPVASAPSPTGKTPPKGEEAEESPPKKAPRLDDAAPATATVPGASEPNPTGESPPKKKTEGSPPKRSRSASPRRQDRRPAAAVPLPTVPESSELTVKGAERASDKKECKCNHVITDSAIEDMTPLLDSKDAWTCCDCRNEDDLGVVKTRPKKRDLLICVTCYDHLCCGVGSIAYPSGHSRAHALKKKHWFAILSCDPERGYCFKCNAEVPSVGQTEAEVNPKKVEMTGKVQAESRPSGFGVDLAHKWPRYESRSSDARGYAIRGIENLGNTCYMNAVLQCLFVLGKLRERMLALNHPKGILPEILRELFVETSGAGDVLDPRKVLAYVGRCKSPLFQVGAMEDSHELLTALRDIWKEDEKVFDWQSDTVIDSIFGFEMLQTVSCKKCGPSYLPSDYFLDLKLDFPSKWHPTNSAASPQTSERTRSPKMEIANAQKYLEKLQIIDITGSEDSNEAQCISQSKDVVQSPLQIQDGESVDSLTEDSVEYFLLHFGEEHQEPQRCQNCAKDDGGVTVRICRFITLPPVLTLHLNRTAHDTVGIKISCHVKFKEYLDVQPFMDSSSVEKGSTRYRLAGVVVHIGKGSLESGHYIAYVGARRPGNQQEGSRCSSSWFLADDDQIRQVSLDKVLDNEAYILFYERMEEQEISDTNLGCWELINNDDIVNFTADPDHCYIYTVKRGNTLWRKLLKYMDYILSVVENNKIHIESLQQGAELIQQFGPILDRILPFPLSSIVLKVSSHIDQANQAAVVTSQVVQQLRDIIPPEDEFVVLCVANKAQAEDAFVKWELSRWSESYCVVLDCPEDDHDALKKVLVDLGAGRLLLPFHP